jgi:RHS repeat-associated protein
MWVIVVALFWLVTGEMPLGSVDFAIRTANLYSHDAKPHVVIYANGVLQYGYDANGNLTTRDGATLTWDAETRLSGINQDGRVTTFTYDADGRRVKKVTPWGTTYYIGEHYERYVPVAGLSTLPGDVDEPIPDCAVRANDLQAIAARWGETWGTATLKYDVDQDGSAIDAGDIQIAAANWRVSVPSPCDQATTKYYRLGGRLVALRQNGQLRYVHSDHLGSVSLLTDADGKVVPGSVQRFFPFGKVRAGQPVLLPTGRNFTGQQLDVNTGLLYYGSSQRYGRYYDPALGRFAQPDMVVPNPGDPQQLNRYSYAANNPLRYRDPSGHWFETVWDIANILWDIHEVRQDPSLVNIGALVVDVGAAVLPFVPAGAGLVARGGKVAKTAVEVATHADEAVDVAKAVSKVEDVRHATTSADAVRSILRRIDPRFFNPESRLGRAFYLAGEGATAVAEVQASGREARHVIRFQLDIGKAKVLDLTDPAIAKAWGYVRDPAAKDLHQAIAQQALEAGYDVIKFESYRAPGTFDYAILQRFEELLIPQMVSPVP